MASLKELFDLSSDSELLNRITSAVVIAAEAIRNEDPGSAIRLAWAASAFESPRREARRMLWAMLAAHAGASAENITGASDEQVQSAVNDAVDVFATGA